MRRDMAFQQRWGWLERSGWIVLARVVLAMLAGVVFHGPVSHARARKADNSVAIDHDRFARKTALTCFTCAPPRRTAMRS
jgi:hypothetical protein